MKNKGFTLLELLVVALIIGILAAIAVPQYKLTVDKTTFTKYQSLVSSLRDAYNEYVIIHGTGTQNFSDLSFTLPSNFKKSYNGWYYNCSSSHDMFCCISKEREDQNPNILCGKKEFAYIEILFNKQLEPKKWHFCYALTNNTRANRLCKSIGKLSKKNINSWTPEGYILVNRYTVN